VNEKQANKNDLKHKKYLDAIHLKEFKAVRAKINKIVNIDKSLKNALIEDLKEVNGDLLGVLYNCPNFVSCDDYKATINAYLRLEEETYKYYLGTYKVGYMKKLIKIVTTRHRYLELRAKILER
jgi:hypothetical protein